MIGLSDSLCRTHRNRCSLVGLTAALTGDKLQQAFDSQQKALSADRNITKLQAKLQEQLEVPPDVEIEALQIVACPESPRLLTARSRDVPTMTLQDLLWLCRSISRNQADLWHYVRARRIEPTRLFVWDEINAWEWWVSNDKSFHAGGTGHGRHVHRFGTTLRPNGFGLQACPAQNGHSWR